MKERKVEEREVHDDVRKRDEKEEPRLPKNNRVGDPRAPSKPLRAKHIFVDGVNHRKNDDSF